MKIKPAKKPGNVLVQLGPKDQQLLPTQPALSSTDASPFKLKKILVPIDFSDCSRKALAYAGPFAKQFDASLTLLYVVQVNYAVGDFGAIDFPMLEEEIRTNAQKEMLALVKKDIGEQVPAETLLRVGRPVQEIVAAAKEQEIDLIIISTHGHTGLKHVFLGSVTENVVRYAPCPVLTVREQEHEFLTG